MVKEKEINHTDQMVAGARPDAREFVVDASRGEHSATGSARTERDAQNWIGLDRDSSRARIRLIITSYDSIIVRTYCRIRFVILNLRFLEELDQYIPRHGAVVDFGCGFGLFSLYFASTARGRRITGVDLNEARVKAAQLSAKRLSLSNASYTAGNATDYLVPNGLNCVYMLDLLHHIPQESVAPLLQRIYDALLPDGILLIKDVDTVPAYKRLFTLALDRVMVGLEPIHYWPSRELISLLESLGFEVYSHEMRDILPYAHRLYICRKR
ncbi:MAG: class I SAM-dependent methyltransferase [Planctomycetes bacterium]|nr:class I SAM-dependent methyltransferase [Planctomycetota bacterium]